MFMSNIYIYIIIYIYDNPTDDLQQIGLSTSTVGPWDDPGHNPHQPNHPVEARSLYQGRLVPQRGAALGRRKLAELVENGFLWDLNRIFMGFLRGFYGIVKEL